MNFRCPIHRIYKEVTSDRGMKLSYSARDNNATYICTSAYMHDAISDYKRKYNRIPTARWYNKHSQFELVKQSKRGLDLG